MKLGISKRQKVIEHALPTEWELEKKSVTTDVILRSRKERKKSPGTDCSESLEVRLLTEVDPYKVRLPTQVDPYKVRLLIEVRIYKMDHAYGIHFTSWYLYALDFFKKGHGDME